MTLTSDMLNKPGQYPPEELLEGATELETFLQSYADMQAIIGVPNPGLLEYHIRNLRETARVLTALSNGAVIVRDKSPPYRWENTSDPLRPQIPTATIDSLLKSGRVKMERIDARFLSHRLVLPQATINS